MKEGIELCHENVYRLLRSGERELNAGSYAVAAMLSILAVEEQARKIILFSAYSGMVEIDHEWWKTMFRSHIDKIAVTTMSLLSYAEEQKPIKGDLDIEKFEKMASVFSALSKKTGKRLQRQKELATYVTYDMNRAKWFHPGAITEKTSRRIHRFCLKLILGTDKYMEELAED